MAQKTGVKVLSTWRSTFGLRVLIALKEKGVEYEYQEENLPFEKKSQLLLESNPVHKKIPVLIHNGKPICESLIILQYIDEAWPASPDGTNFLPEDPYERALERFWADYVDKQVLEALVLMFKNEEGSEMMEKGRKDFKAAIMTLDKALKEVFGGKRYFRGEHKIGLVDMTLASYLCWFETVESLGSFKVLDEKECPHLFSWAQNVSEYPSVKGALAIAPSHKVIESARFIRKTLFGLRT